MNAKLLKLTTASAALFALVGTPVLAGAFDASPVIDVTGDGYVFADPEEGVLPPGIKSITEEPGAEYPNTENPQGVLNCLMASNPDLLCNAPSGSGKRIKTRLTGKDGMDISLSTESTGDVTEYYFFGKTSNLSGARMTGYQLEIGTGTGDDFTAFTTNDPTFAALFDVEFTDGSFNLPDGLFGDGGQESDAGFFDDASQAEMNTDTLTAALIELGEISSNAVYTALFGNGYLDDSQIPDGYFFDVTDYEVDADEPALLAWYNVSEGAWVYGNVDDEVVTYAEAEFGFDIGYVAGGEVPADVVAALEANGLFEVDAIEDLRNLNLNFMIELGDVAGNQVTLRLTPVFSQLVSETYTEYQFKIAGMLDAAAEIPYLDTGNAALYGSAVTGLLALDEAAQLDALESVGFSFLGGYGALGYDLGRGFVSALPDRAVEFSNDGATLSTRNMLDSWSIGEMSYGFVSAQSSMSSYDATLNGVGYDTDAVTFTGGIEWQVDPSLSWGVMLGGGNGSVEADGNRGTIDMDGVGIGLFARKAFGTGGTMTGVIGYQALTFDSTREVLSGTALATTALGETDGSQIFAALSADYTYRNGAFTYGPRASLEYYKQSVDAYDETGAGAWNLSVGKQNSETLIASAGFWGEYELPFSAQDTRLTGGLSLNSSAGDNDAVSVGLVGLFDTALPVDGFDDQWIGVDFGVSTTLASGASGSSTLSAGYHGAFGDGYESHGLEVSFNVAF
ncbi:choice-of-anchor F family protein [Celeribacter litoreus]|uniref:choice-of-anchor F family protein n=1 Tax=Celeribacter litoreus TaxID=2876714 RepID=UPI001CCDE043|nr:choice-of-anchor F family protein [Celeribacter litoreus]MCA0044593.1 choice-of-anchor F family protein [Celeribacter litoreus]